MKSVSDKEQLDDFIRRSHQEPVVIFKHSTACPISSAAYRELEGYPGEIALVEVQSARDLSREIGARTGVKHESPQVIILRNGKAVWNASHWKITAQDIEQAMRDNA